MEGGPGEAQLRIFSSQLFQIAWLSLLSFGRLFLFSFHGEGSEKRCVASLTLLDEIFIVVIGVGTLTGKKKYVAVSMTSHCYYVINVRANARTDGRNVDEIYE